MKTALPVGVKNALSTARKILVIALSAFTICVMIFTVFSVTSFEKPNGVFGYKFFIVLSDSMQEEFGVGDVAVSKQADPSALQEGDIITFESIDPANYGSIVTHKVQGRTTHEGKPAFITYGTTTGVADGTPALEENIIGKYQFRIPKVGYIFNFLKSPPGYLTLIFIPFFILIILEGMRFFSLLKKYKYDQKMEMDEEKKHLLEEKEETEKLIEELNRLTAQFENQETAADSHAVQGVQEEWY